jgi:hypothetical protein
VLLFNPHISLFTFISSPFASISNLSFTPVRNLSSTPARNLFTSTNSLFMLLPPLCIIPSRKLALAFLRFGVVADIVASMAVMMAIAAAGAAIDKNFPQLKLNTRQSFDCLFYFFRSAADIPAFSKPSILNPGIENENT